MATEHGYSHFIRLALLEGQPNEDFVIPVLIFLLLSYQN